MFAKSAFALVLCTLSIAAAAQDAVLLPAAQKAFDRGIKAAQQQQWSLAARYFSDARKIAGNDARILTNLGLAYGKGGDELQAIVLLNASLARAPEAQNIQQVRQEIGRLKTAVRAKIQRILMTASEAAEKMPLKEVQNIPGFGGPREFDNLSRQDSFRYVGDALAKAGEFEEAQKQYELQGSSRGRVSDDRLRAERSKAFAEAGDFQTARLTLKAITEDRERDEVALRIVQDILEKFERSAEDKKEAELFAEIVADQGRKAKVVATVQLAKLRDQFNQDLNKGEIDAHLVNELLAKSEAQSRTRILESLAQWQMEKGNFSASQSTIDKIDRQQYWMTSGLTASQALHQVKAGKRSEAGETARRLASIIAASRNSQDARQVEPLVAVVKAVQGDYLGAAQAAASAGQPPNQIYTSIDDYIGFYDAGLNWFSLSQRQALVGAVVFCAAMAGRHEDAAKIVRQQKYVSGLQNYANTNVAYAYLLQGNIVKALDAGKAIPVRNEQANDNGRAQILGLVMLEQIKRGDIRGAEKSAHLMTGFGERWWFGAQYKVESLLHVALAFHRSKQPIEAKRVTGEAVKVIRDGLVNPDAPRIESVDVDGLRERIAKAQEKMGDHADAQATRDQKDLTSSTVLKTWLALLDDYEFNSEQLRNPEKRIAEIAKESANRVPISLVFLANSFGKQIRRIEYLEKKLGSQ